MTPKFRLRRWLFGKHRRSPIIQILARQCEKNLSHFNNEDRNHYRNGEWWLQRALVNFYLSQQNRLTVFDVGANNGIWALNLLKMGTSIDLHCFEPSEKTYEELVEALSPFVNVKTNMVGLSKAENVVNFFENDAPDVTSYYQRFDAHIENTISVKLILGDSYVRLENIEEIDFLKIDIEGMEFDALLGFKRTLQEGRINVIQFEYGEFNIQSQKLLKHFYELLSDYDIGKLYPNYVEFGRWHLDLENFKPANYIAVKKSNQQLVRMLS